MHFDLRRSTDVTGSMLPEAHPGLTTREVMVGGHPGAVVLDSDLPVQILWKTDTHAYRLFVSGARTVEDLVRIAETIR